MIHYNLSITDNFKDFFHCFQCQVSDYDPHIVILKNKCLLSLIIETNFPIPYFLIFSQSYIFHCYIFCFFALLVWVIFPLFVISVFTLNFLDFVCLFSCCLSVNFGFSCSCKLPFQSFRSYNLLLSVSLLPTRASEQGNVIGLVSVYIYIYMS